MKKIRFIVLVLVLTVLTVGCATQDTVKISNNLTLKPELVELFDETNVQNAITEYVKLIVNDFNNKNLMVENDTRAKYYKIFSNYIDDQTNGIFKSTVSNKERDLRMQRVKKGLELQEIEALISKSSGQLTNEQSLEIQNKIETILKSYFEN